MPAVYQALGIGDSVGRPGVCPVGLVAYRQKAREVGPQDWGLMMESQMLWEPGGGSLLQLKRAS